MMQRKERYLIITLRVLAVIILALAAVGCMTNFRERHHFKSLSLNEENQRPNNYFRLTIEGYASFSSARYVSGFYDERAVDLFFNEIKTGTKNCNLKTIPMLFESNLTDPGSDNVIKPLFPDDGNGAFVMILSTNASAVANAIGSFAESQAVADALTNLVNRDVIRKVRLADAEQDVIATDSVAVINELDSLFNKLDPSDRATLIRGYMRILNVIGDALEPGTRFKTLDEAETWLLNRPRR